MNKDWLFAIGASVILVVGGLWVWRKLNPAPSTITQTYTNETDKSTITVGPATVKPLSGKKNWAIDRAIATDGKVIA